MVEDKIGPDQAEDSQEKLNDESPETYTEIRSRTEKQMALLKEQIARRKVAEETLSRESGLIKLLQEVTAAANQAKTIEGAFRIALERICTYTGWPVGHVYLWSADEEKMVSSRIWSDIDGRFQEIRAEIESIHFSPGEGWLGNIASTGQAAWITDVSKVPNFARSHRLEKLGICFVFAFPVLVDTEVAAILEFFSPEVIEPDEILLDAMSRGGEQLGLVMERVQAREALEHHRALLADAERLAHLGNWEWDIVRNKVTWSDEMFRIYGISRDDFGGSYEAYLTRVHPGDRDKVTAIIQGAYEEKIPFRFHHRIIRPDGQEATLLAQGKPLLNDAGELVRMIGTGQDVTEQKENEYRLAHRAEQIAALSEMGQTATVTLELEIVFEKVLDKLLPLLGASSVNILLLEGSDLVFAAGNDVGNRELVGKRVPVSASLAGEVLRTGRPIGVHGQEAGERVFHQIVDSAGYRPGALLVAPLKLRSELIGVIEAVYPETAVFNDEDLRLLEAAASWTAIAIGNARLFERQQQARQVAEMLRDANLKLTHSLELQTVLQTILDNLTQLISCTASSVKIVEGSCLVARVVRGREHNDPRYNLVSLPPNHPLKIIAETGRSLLIADTAEFAGWDEQLGSLEEARSWLGVPLLAGGRLIGVYTASSDQVGFFKERLLLLAEALAGQAAIAVQNARLFSQIRLSRERLRYLTRQVVTAQEVERRRVSRELHDEAGQALTALKISLNLIRTSLPDEQADTRDQLAEIIDLADKTMQQIRMLAQDLRPPVLDTFGLNPSLEGFCEEFARRANLIIHYEGVDLPSLSDTANISFYRFLQEALNNIAKHAEADETWVRLQKTVNLVCLTLKDNGRGFNVENELAKERAGGLGLLGMQERFELLGGRVEIFSTPGEGTEITASMPFETENTEENT